MEGPVIGVFGRRDRNRRRTIIYGLVIPRAIFGSILVLMGVCLTLGNMGILEIDSIWHFWPLSLVGVGLAKVFQARGTPGRGFGAVLLLAGVWLQLSYLGFLPFRARYFWPAMLIVLGGSLIWRGVAGARVGGPPPDETRIGFDTGSGDAGGGGGAGDAGGAAGTEGGPGGPGAGPASGFADGVEAERVGPQPRRQESTASSTPISVVAVLGGVEHRNSSEDFRGGNVSAILGGCDIDLRRAKIAGDQAVLDVFAFWGGVEIKVPESWTVHVKGVPILGAFNDRSHPPREGPAKTLVISGAAIMGGVEIKN